MEWATAPFLIRMARRRFYPMLPASAWQCFLTIIKKVLIWEIPRWTISRRQKILGYIIKSFRLDMYFKSRAILFFFILSLQRDFKKKLWNLLHSILIENNWSLKSWRKFRYRESVWVFESLRSSSELYLSCTSMCYSTPKKKMKSDQYK